MYRNSKGYSDPTAGIAIAHITYEERVRKRKAWLKRQEEKRTAAAREQETHRKQKRKKSPAKKPEPRKPTRWVKAWTRAEGRIIMPDMEERK